MYVKSGTLPTSGVNTVAGYIFLPEKNLAYAFAILCKRRERGSPAYSGTFTIPLMTAMVKAFR